MRSITIPADGVTESFSNIKKGLSLLIIQAPAVDNVFEDSATFSFEDQGNAYPATTGTRIPFGDCHFREIKITGTAATAGQELIVASIPVCVDPYINLDPNEVNEAQSGNTFILDWTGDANSVKQFTELQLANSDGELPTSVYIEARNADIIYRSNDGGGTDPANADADESFLLPSDTGDLREIQGIDFILNVRFTNATVDEEPILVVWPRY